MAHEINYATRYSDEFAKQSAALGDMERWLNKEQYKTLVAAANMPDVTYAHFSFYCSFAGVSGYPVLCFWNEYRMIPDFHVQDWREREEG